MATDLNIGSIIFWGSSHLPGDLLLDLQHIREWAAKEGAIPEEDALITESVLEELTRVYNPGDELGNVSQVSEDVFGKPMYLEYPYVPVKTLINKGQRIRLMYWIVEALEWDDQGRIARPRGIRFGFLVESCPLELASVAQGKKTVTQFAAKYDEIHAQFDTRTEFEAGEPLGKLIETNEKVEAIFTKSGNTHDVAFFEGKPE